MRFTGLFKKRISIKRGKKLLSDYCIINKFEDKNTQWKKPQHHTNWFFAYSKYKNRMISNNWVSCHYVRGDNRYSIWIDLVTEEIYEILRRSKR